MGDRNRAPLIALAASIGLIAVYVAFGGGSYTPAATADPCEPRDAAVLEERGVFEGIALSALDGAACELHVSREELTLALADEQATEDFAAAHGIDSDAVDDAVRAGLERAVDDAAAAGRIDGIEETILRQVARYAPVGPGDRRPPGALRRRLRSGPDRADRRPHERRRPGPRRPRHQRPRPVAPLSGTKPENEKSRPRSL